MTLSPISPRETSVARSEARRLVAGRGKFIDNITLPGLLYLSFVRSPIAHGLIKNVEIEQANTMPGVARVMTASDYAPLISEIPKTKLETMPGHNSPAQLPLVDRHVRYQGEPVVVIAAETQLQAEDAAAAVNLEYTELPVISDLRSVNFDNDNIASEFKIGPGVQEKTSATHIEAQFSFERQTGVTLEPRGIVVDYDSISDELTVWQSHQSPHLVQVLLARILGMAENRIRVHVGDVGGGFGVKLHLYPDEIAAVLAARLLSMPVKYVATRMESFQSDAQAREFDVTAKISFTEGGELIGMEGDFNNAIGAYSIFPRSSIGDSIQAAVQLGAPYKMEGMSSRSRTFWQNKPPSGAIRGVGQPIPCTVTEQLIDMAARKLGEDPALFRKRHYLNRESFPHTTHGGLYMDKLSLADCLDLLIDQMSYFQLREEQERLRSNGILRGIGIATFVEQTALGPGLYGAAGVPATSVEECQIRLEADGTIRAETGATDQGQGTLTGIRQIIARALDVDLDTIQICSSDSAGARGGGAWASRGLSLAGEAAVLAADDLLENIRNMAGHLLQASPTTLTLKNNTILGVGGESLTLKDLAKIVWYQPYNLPDGAIELFSVSRSYTSQERPHFMANGIQGSLVDIDVDTGKVKPLKHWVVEDCGNIINRDLVDGQIMGGSAQGIGAALNESCHYDANGQLVSGSFLDYAVPRADDIPPIEVSHITTPLLGTKLGVKGVGEAGVIGAPASLWGAVNDALFHLGVRVDRQPITSENVLNAILRANRFIQ